MSDTITPTSAPTAEAARPTENRGVTGLVVLQARTELRSTGRSIEFLIGAVAIPALLFAMIGLPSADRLLPGGTRAGAMLLVAWTSYGIVSLAIFTFGEYVAHDRAGGWTRTMRTTPLPAWGYLAAKLVVGVLCAAAIVASTSALAATAGGVTVSAGVWIRFALVMLLGLLTLSTLGFAIAYLARPRAAAATANLLFLPLSFLSGFFVPLSQLPTSVQNLAGLLPTHHLGQLAWRQFAPTSDVEHWIGGPLASAATNTAWLAGSCMVFALLASWSARREAANRRG
jgi:ABC-2 type transport system permease protein